MLTSDESLTTVPCLDTVAALLERLHEADFPYCHWKGNEHLHAALSALKDIDLLVPREAALPLGAILSRTGFKRFLAAPACRYPGIEDYLSLDQRSGRLVHLHLHYQLTLGEPYHKGYRLPWEHTVLARRQWHPEAGVYVSDPSMEFLLLMVRTAVMLRLRDTIAARAGRQCLGDGKLKEYHWLRERLDETDLLRLGRQLLGEQGARLVMALRSEPPTVRQLHALCRAARPAFRDYQTYSPAQARRRQWVREWHRWKRAFVSRLGGAPAAPRRTLPQGGAVIALVGSDGAGKSTVVAEITRWLASKTDIVPLYFGSGDGPVSPWRRALLSARPARRRNPALPPGAQGGPRPRRRLQELYGTLWALAIACEKRQRLRQARHARNQGQIVICDRFPQCQIPGTTDGPLLDRWSSHSNRLLSSLARWERSVYHAAEAGPPDLVLKLQVTPTAAAARKPKVNPGYLAKRAEVIRALRYPPGTRVVEIDADQPMSQVLLQVKRAIWETL
jgi:thymidylate kinase